MSLPAVQTKSENGYRPRPAQKTKIAPAAGVRLTEGNKMVTIIGKILQNTAILWYTIITERKVQNL